MIKEVPRFFDTRTGLQRLVSAPLDLLRVFPGSVDGYMLHIDELKGTRPVESIDISRRGLGVASAIIIARCIKKNTVLKKLKCALRPEPAIARPSKRPPLPPQHERQRALRPQPVWTRHLFRRGHQQAM